MSMHKTAVALIAAILMLAPFLEATTYYVNSHAGNDGHDGMSAETAWKSLKKANSVKFKPGDVLLLASNCVFNGQLAPKGSGVMQNGRMVPIRIDRYGEGPLPRINGQGKVVAPLFLKNVAGWEVSNLELTNLGRTRKSFRYGIYVENSILPTARHFIINNVTVRDVNGDFTKDRDASAGIRFNAVQGKGTSGPGRNFDRILIENCLIKNCSRNGVVVHGGGMRENWNPSTSVIIRHNLIEGVGGDGILPISCKGPLVEWNIMRDCPAYGEAGGAAAGMWPWSCDDAVFQFNEVVGHKAWNDAQAYDCDYNCNNTVYQYNLSRDNEGGFMLICSPGIKKRGWLVQNAWNRGSVVRYNLSINDGLRTAGRKEFQSPVFSITGETTRDTDIHENLIILPKKPDARMDSDLFDFDQWGGKYPVNTTIRDNVFVLLDGQPGTFDFGRAKQVLFEGNRFYGPVEPILETAEVKELNNVFTREVPSEVRLTGTNEELRTFARFLESKGNPQEAHGIMIRWEPDNKLNEQ